MLLYLPLTLEDLINRLWYKTHFGTVWITILLTKVLKKWMIKRELCVQWNQLSEKLELWIVIPNFGSDMSFRTLRFGDRTISYDAGLDLVGREGKRKITLNKS